MQEQPCRWQKQPYTASLHHGLPRWAISRLWFDSLQRPVTPNIAVLNKQVKKNEARDNQKCASAQFLSGYFSFVRLHFRHFEQSMFFESHIFKPTVCLAQEPELVQAIGQELQKIQLVDNQSLNNIERKLPLFPNLSASCVGQCCRKGTWHLGGVLLWQKASLGVEVQLSSVSLLPHHLMSCWWGTDVLEIFCCCILWFLFAAHFQPHCKWSFKLYPSLNPSPKSSWGWAIDSFPLTINQTKYFSQPPSLQPLLSFCNPILASLPWEYWHFFLSALTLNMGWEVLPDLH